MSQIEAVKEQVLGKRKFQGPVSTDACGKVAKAMEKNPPLIISHNAQYQRAFKQNRIPYGIQYEIARRLQSDTSNAYNVIDKDNLQGLDTNVTGIKRVMEIFGEESQAAVFSKEVLSKAPWGELDAEDDNLARDRFSGLGFGLIDPSWFGGKVHFTATLFPASEKDSDFRVILQTPELGPSDRFRRRWGSGRFLTLKLPKFAMNLKGTVLEEFMKRPFILLDRVFRAFDAKDSQVFLVATNEFVEAGRIHSFRTIPELPSLKQFLEWHNPLQCNGEQVYSFSSGKLNLIRRRFALGRSNSAPVLRLKLSAIKEMDDIYSSTGSVMTDGAGLINKAALKLIYNNVLMDTWPTAIQCRIQGHHFYIPGLLVLDGTQGDTEPTVWLRPSQRKINYLDCGEEDPTLRTIDMLRSSNAKADCRIPVETIINLSENSVPSTVFIKCAEETLNNILAPLISWQGRHAMEKLWCAVAHVGGVMSARRARHETVLARVKGYVEHQHEGSDADDDDKVTSQSLAWWVDEISGSPSSLEETVMYLLDSGFTPQDCAVLRSKLQMVVQGCVDRYINSYRIDLPSGFSSMAFIVPDERSVLNPGEFFFKTSKCDIRTAEGLLTDTLLGDALITRNPCKLPTDVQKVPLHFYCPQLRHLTDVIICCSKGHRRAADLLSGGDYDGDKALLIWDPEFVNTFHSAPAHFSVEPESIADSFCKINESVKMFCERTIHSSPEEQIQEMQHYLLGSLHDVTKVGKYSNWHLNAIYSLGYTHPETIRLAYMFCKTLDGAKTGLRVIPDVYKTDQQKYERRAPKWKEAEKKKGKGAKYDTSNMVNLQRGSGLKPFIMDILLEHAQNSPWRVAITRQLEGIFSPDQGCDVDPDLTAPWLDFLREHNLKEEAEAGRDTARRLLDGGENQRSTDLAKIQQHVEALYAKHRNQVRGMHATLFFTTFAIEMRQDKLRKLSLEFASGPSALSMSNNEAARIKASYAYYFDGKQRSIMCTKWSRFPWDVAFRELCLIKAQSAKDVSFKPLSTSFYEHFKMQKPRGTQ
ncbi:RNA dependent RNA polymerase-domain-containing protein [Mycena crocata]|nr:RNA dependent RNA polymerase-domain-containing protein [Mycena crocata]